MKYTDGEVLENDLKIFLRPKTFHFSDKCCWRQSPLMLQKIKELLRKLVKSTSLFKDYRGKVKSESKMITDPFYPLFIAERKYR